jgi:hypothetical protein
MSLLTRQTHEKESPNCFASANVEDDIRSVVHTLAADDTHSTLPHKGVGDRGWDGRTDRHACTDLSVASGAKRSYRCLSMDSSVTYKIQRPTDPSPDTYRTFWPQMLQVSFYVTLSAPVLSFSAEFGQNSANGRIRLYFDLEHSSTHSVDF